MSEGNSHTHEHIYLLIPRPFDEIKMHVFKWVVAGKVAVEQKQLLHLYRQMSACAVPSKYRIIYRDCGETEDVLNIVSSMYRRVKCQPWRNNACFMQWHINKWGALVCACTDEEVNPCSPGRPWFKSQPSKVLLWAVQLRQSTLFSCLFVCGNSPPEQYYRSATLNQ